MFFNDLWKTIPYTAKAQNPANAQKKYQERTQVYSVILLSSFAFLRLLCGLAV